MNKIIQVQSDGNWVNNEGQTMYTFEVLLDDQHSAYVSAKTADRWKVGDEVEVSKKWLDKGGKNRMSLSKPRKDGQPSKFNNNDDVQMQIGNSWAITTALTYLQLVTNSAGQLTPNEIAIAAKMFVDMRDGLEDWKAQDETMPY